LRSCPGRRPIAIGRRERFASFALGCEGADRALTSNRDLLTKGAFFRAGLRGLRVPCAESLRARFRHNFISKGDCKSMSTGKVMKHGQESEDHLAEPEVDTATDVDTHKPTFADQLILTTKILAGFGLVGVALWAAELWISAG
jgi:hypothetical protein